MNVKTTPLPGVLIVEPRVFRDHRGAFIESWAKERYEAAGMHLAAQDNVSWSQRNVLRGLHYQIPNPQAKLVQVLSGRAFDVAVDIRPQSPTFRQWFGLEMDSVQCLQLYIPAGFAHGFCALTDEVVFTYKCSQPYDHPGDRSIFWNDPDIRINWPISDPILAPKDADAPRLAEIHSDQLPQIA